MIFDKHERLNLSLFDDQLLTQTNRLDDLLIVVSQTGCNGIESTHFLLVLIKIHQGVTQKLFHQYRVSPQQLEKGLRKCVQPSANPMPPEQLAITAFNASGHHVLTNIQKMIQDEKIDKIDEKSLLLVTLQALTPKVVKLFQLVQLFPKTLIEQLTALPLSTPSLQIWKEDAVNLQAFSARGCQVLKLMKNEAESLGYTEMDPRHLLLALLAIEKGMMATTLYQQDIFPRQVQERVLLNLRQRAQKQRTQLTWQQDQLTSPMLNILKEAGARAEQDYCTAITEIHLIYAFLTVKTFALQLLQNSGVKSQLMQDALQTFPPEDETAVSTTKRSWKEIKKGLQTALVGQTHAVDLCLPFIQRMFFDFQRPGNPIGVFLFCGPSGVGKTEMAKAIAQAVFGSKENLIMLEMGQFQTKESMNIFVGAPPGYIGYGEGKLTNGLRDKPQSVVLFDEVEKAHPQVFDALLRFIDEGQIDDPAGPIRDGSQCVIIMTSNVMTGGLETLLGAGGYEKNKWQIRKKIKQALLNQPSSSASRDTSGQNDFRFRAEFLNRIDEIILFRALDEQDMAQIACRHLLAYQKRLQDEKQIHLTFAPNLDAMAGVIGRFCATLDEGARATKRVVHTAVLDPVIDFVYTSTISPPLNLVVHIPYNPANVEEPRGIVALK